MIAKRRIVCIASLGSICVVLGAIAATAQAKIPAGSKVYIAPMDGFETDLKAALEAKKVPLQVVDKKEDAAYEITGTATSQKAGKAKKIIMGSWHSKEEASIQVTDLKAGTVVFAYSYHVDNSTHGKRSSAESCAKHLKEAVGNP